MLNRKLTMNELTGKCSCKPLKYLKISNIRPVFSGYVFSGGGGGGSGKQTTDFYIRGGGGGGERANHQKKLTSEVSGEGVGAYIRNSRRY